MLEDHSSNGTYVDDVRVKQGEPMVLSSGSKVSLVRSVTPWVERCFTFWEGLSILPGALLPILLLLSYLLPLHLQLAWPSMQVHSWHLAALVSSLCMSLTVHAGSV